MLTNSIRLFTVRGIEVGVHYSWLIIFALITWSLGVYLFPNTVPGLSTGEYWILGAVAAVTEPRIEVVASYVALINILLGAFNLIPGFPLDGGRVLRSIVWTITGSLRRATEFAATVGKLVAYVMFGFGILRLADGDLIGGIWI